MYYKEKDPKIKQLIPVPECRTPLQYFSLDKCIYDVSGTVFYALMEEQEEDDETCIYTFDDLGIGGIIDRHEIIFVQTIHCKRCGQRMKIAEIPCENFRGFPFRQDLTYTCPCGMKYHTVLEDPSAASEWEE